MFKDLYEDMQVILIETHALPSNSQKQHCQKGRGDVVLLKTLVKVVHMVTRPAPHLDMMYESVGLSWYHQIVRKLFLLRKKPSDKPQ